MSDMLAVVHSHGDNPRFRATAARNAKRFLQRPDFFLCFDSQDNFITRRRRAIAWQAERTESKEANQKKYFVIFVSFVVKYGS